MINITPAGHHFRITEEEVEAEIDELVTDIIGRQPTHSDLDAVLAAVKVEWVAEQKRATQITYEAIEHLRSNLPPRT